MMYICINFLLENISLGNIVDRLYNIYIYCIILSYCWLILSDN